MSAASAALGWLVALPALAVVAATRRELARRGELVARACHEVRGPLTSARLGIALAGRAGQSVQAGLAAVDMELRRAGLALEDLHAARTGRRLRDREEPVPLGPLVAQVADAWRGFAEANGVEVTLVDTDADADVTVRGDRLRLAQAIGNLVANAIEHGEGQVRVSMSSDRGRARVEVIDAGPGLPVSVAELTARPSAGRGRRGRGLAIASEIAARHGGRLAGAPSARGARLALELPLLPATRAERA